MRDGEAWLEARSTATGLLDDLPGEWGEPPEDATRFGGIFSLVVEDSPKKTRSLPTMYHGNAQLYADRDVDKVRSRLVRTIDAVLHANERPAYLIAACRVDDRRGLYTRGVFNREPYRMRAIRAGLVVADDPYLRMTSDGKFECEGWAPFRPKFIVVNKVSGPRGRETENVNKGGLLALVFGILRVGDMNALELFHLSSTIREAEIVAEDDPTRLPDAVRAGTAG